jgi:hypothetical protein
VKHQEIRRVSIGSSLIVSTAMLAVLLSFLGAGARAQDKTTGTADVPPGTNCPSG